MARSIHKYVVEELTRSDVEDVHAETSIPISTLRKIRDGVIKNPGIKSIEELYFHFRDREGRLLRRRAAA